MTISRCTHLLHLAGRTCLNFPPQQQALRLSTTGDLFKRALGTHRKESNRNGFKVGLGAVLLLGSATVAAAAAHHLQNPTLEPEPTSRLTPLSSMSMDEGLKIFKRHLDPAFHPAFDQLSKWEKERLITQDLRGSPTLIVLGATYLASLWRDKSQPKDLVEFRKSIGESVMGLYSQSVETVKKNVPASLRQMVDDLLYFYAFWGDSQVVSFPKDKEASALKELFVNSSKHSTVYRGISDGLFYQYFIGLTHSLKQQGLLQEGEEGTIIVPRQIKWSGQRDFVLRHYGKLETEAVIALAAYRKRWDSNWIPPCLKTVIGFKTIEEFRNDQRLQLEKGKLVWLLNTVAYVDQTAPEGTSPVANVLHLIELMKSFPLSSELMCDVLNRSRSWAVATKAEMQDLSFNDAVDLFTHLLSFLSNSNGDQWVTMGNIFLFNGSKKALKVIQSRFSGVAFEAFAKSLEEDSTIKHLDVQWEGDVQPARMKALRAALSKNRGLEQLSFSDGRGMRGDELFDLLKCSPPQLKKIILPGFKRPKEKRTAIEWLLERKGIQIDVRGS